MTSIIKVDTLQKANGATPTAADLGINTSGTVLQVVTANYSTVVVSDNNTWVDTGLSCAITPTSSNSKIMILIDQNGRVESSWMAYRILRGTTEIKGVGYYLFDNNSTNNSSISFNFLDSPNTTSEVTYKTQFMRSQGGGDIKVNDNSAPATILLIEIAG
jgi:hypothetical protein